MHSPARPRRLVVPALLAALALAAGCSPGRERLDVPRLSIQLPDSVAAPGDRIEIRAQALDESGVTYLAMRLICAGDIVDRWSYNFARTDSVVGRFLMVVPSSIAPNSRLVVESETIDEQNFSTRATDTLTIRAPGVPPGPPPGPGCVDRAAP